MSLVWRRIVEPYQSSVLWPWTNRDLDNGLLDIDEPGISHQFLGDQARAWFFAHFSRAREEVLGPLIQGDTLFVGAIIGVEVVIAFLELDPAAGFRVSIKIQVSFERLFTELRPTQQWHGALCIAGSSMFQFLPS